MTTSLLVLLLLRVPSASAIEGVCAQPTVQCDCGISIPCAGRPNAEIPGACAAACTATTGTSAAGSPALSPGDQAALTGAFAVGQHIGFQLANWLFTGPKVSRKSYAEVSAEQQLQIRRSLEQKAAAFAKALSERERILAELKGEGPAATDDFKESTSPPQTLEGLQKQVQTFDCAMEEVYEAAARLGPQGKAFAAGLRVDVVEAEAGLADEARGTRVLELSRDETVKDEKVTAQIVMKALAIREPATGITKFDFMFDVAGKGLRLGAQNIVILDRFGHVQCQEVSNSVARCMHRIKITTHSRKVDCPKPPKEDAR